MTGRKDATSRPVAQLLYCISNTMRRSMIRSLGDREKATFSELMELCGLSPRYDTTGSFVYHLSQLVDNGVLVKEGEVYELTPYGRRVGRIVGLVERESRRLQEAEAGASERPPRELKAGKVSVRPAGPRDVPVVAELVASEYYDQASREYEVPEEYFEMRRRESDFSLGLAGRNLVFLAEEKGEGVGVCWWTLIEMEATGGDVNREAFLEHLYVRPDHDLRGIARGLMQSSIGTLLTEEKATILNVWHGGNEPLDREFYAEFGIVQPENLELLMHVAEWARPTWEPKRGRSETDN